MSPYSLLTTPLEDKRNSALFILKSKVMYKIPQVHLEHLIEDITGLLERKVDNLRTMLHHMLEQRQISYELVDSLMGVIVNTLSNPFSELETNYLQLKFFEEHFGIIVSLSYN